MWLADEQDQAQIGDPLASVAARHGAPATAATADTADLIAAGIGAITYLAKNLTAAISLRLEARRRLKNGTLPQPEGMHP